MESVTGVRYRDMKTQFFLPKLDEMYHQYQCVDFAYRIDRETFQLRHETFRGHILLALMIRIGP